MNYVYIVECRDGTLYTGWTNNLEARIEKHNQGTGAKYTRARLPVQLKYHKVFDTKQKAMQAEAKIKKMSRAQKIKLIKTDLKMDIKERKTGC